MQERIRSHGIEERCCHRQVSWAGVTIGALAAIGLSFLFGLFATSIGLSALSTTGDKTFLIGGFLGMLILTIFSMGLAGWIAGFLGKPSCSSHNMGCIYGFAAWCLALIVLILISSSVGPFIAASVAHLTNTPSVNPEAVPTTQQIENTAWVTFLTFVLFFIGALSSTLGGHWGFRSRARCALHE